MKNCKSSCEAQKVSCLKNYSASPQPIPQQIKSYYVSGTNIFIRGYIEIYGYLLSKCFKNAVLGHHERVQCKYFFLAPNRNMFAGKFVNSESLLTVFREHIIFNVKWVEVRMFFERTCIVKCVIFFVSFCWLWDFLLENLKLKMMSTGTSG